MDASKIGTHVPKGNQTDAARTACCIVGVGASAGGLEAFTQLLHNLPTDTGLAFVLVQHLDPVHESELTRLLARTTSMPTCEVTDNLPVEPNHVYVIPPNVNMTIAKGVLKLEPRPPGRVLHRSIDFFFESLALDQRERAIGVVLSGTASDGTLGLEAIKAEGGITLAQDESAKHNSMPRSAIAAGCVDYVLSPENIAAELARIARHPYVQELSAATASEVDATALPSGGQGSPHVGAMQARAEAVRSRERPDDEGFKQILLNLRNRCGVDFTLYKSSTIQRRIGRRVILNKQNTLDEYVTFLKGNVKELDALYSDVLISVTSFFRNPEAFETLKQKVFPAILAQRTGDDPLRVWTLGCSTGQEAYSIAMAFAEFSDGIPRVPKLQVFATDLNEALLDKARHGLYAKTLAEDVSPERLRRFFVEEEGGYRINKSLREQIVFARQNLISDPPFSRMDLISCRNLLIYLEPGLQKKIIPTFHYALKMGGFLFLGASESIGQFTDLFDPADRKQKIFSKKAASTPSFHLPASTDRITYPSPGMRPSVVEREQEEGLRGEMNAQREADRVSVNQFAPPGVLVNAELQILQFRGATSAYLEPPTGKASFDLLKMAKKSLMLPLREAINIARNENQTVHRENVRLDNDDGTQTLNIRVIPLKNLKERWFLILFETVDFGQAVRPAQSVSVQQPMQLLGPKPVSNSEETLRISDLDRELAELRDFLQSVQEQSEAANEELQASNEEVQSANEELQSINEELETSKEELESTNEELTTVNEEMSNRNVEVNRLNSDLSNLQVNIHTAILLLGRDLTIRRFTAPAEKMFNLLPTDIGRPISGIRHNLVERCGGGAIVQADSRKDQRDTRQRSDPVDMERSYPLETIIREVIDSLSMIEREVRDRDGRWYSLRVRPYMTLDNKLDGAVLVLVDIDALKCKEREAQTARDYAEATIGTIRDPFLVLHGDLRVNTANEAFYRTFKVRPEGTEGRLIYELGNGQWDIPKLRNLLEDILPRDSFFNDFEMTHEFPTLGRRTMMLNARQLKQNDGTPPLILLAIEDLTDRLESRAAVKASEIRYRRLFETAQDGILILDPVTRKITDANPYMTKLLGYPREELLDKELFEIGLLKDEQASHIAFRELQLNGFIRYEDLPLKTKDGRSVEVEFVSNLFEEADTTVIQCNIRDITERKHAEALITCQKRAFEMAASGAPLMQVLEFLASAVESQSQQGARVAIHLLDESGTRFVQTAAPGLPPSYIQAFTDIEVSSDIGPSCAAVTRRQSVVVADVAASNEWADFAAIALPLNIRAAWTVPIFSLAGKPLGTVASFYREAHDPHPRDNLLGEVVTGTASVIIERKQAEEALLNADRLKNEFLAMLAHELRNPLAPIRNAVQLLRLTEGNGEAVQSAAEMMERQVGQMVRLVDDLLDVSRISRGKIELRRGRIELASSVNHAVEAARPNCESMKHELMVTLPPRPIYLNADPTRLAQVVGNLLNNAYKFTDRGGHIGLTVEREGEQAVIRVRDNGVGIAAEQLPRIFEIFTQIDTSLERSVSGLGIGLTLVKNLVELHGGTVEVRSSGLGQGSEFTVRLPILVEVTKPQPTEQPANKRTPATGRRILVVDDNRDSATSLAMLLKFTGHETYTAFDGLEAVTAAEKVRPDVVLLDIGLPKLNGYEAARQMRAQPWGKEMVLVALTGWGQEEDRQKSKDAGFNGHLVKPVDFAALEKLLASFVSVQSDGRSP